MVEWLGVVGSNIQTLLLIPQSKHKLETPSRTPTQWLGTAGQGQRIISQGILPRVMFDFKYLGQTINQLGRRYITMITTSLSTHTVTRQLRAVRVQVKLQYPTLSKSMLSYIVKYIVCSVNGTDAVYFPNEIFPTTLS